MVPSGSFIPDSTPPAHRRKNATDSHRRTAGGVLSGIAAVGNLGIHAPFSEITWCQSCIILTNIACNLLSFENLMSSTENIIVSQSEVWEYFTE